MAILRYPYRAPVSHGSNHRDADGATYAIDWVRFKSFAMTFANDDKSFYGGNIGSVKSDKKYDSETVYINMPPSLSTTYQANYRTVDLGVGGIGLANAIQNTADGAVDFDQLANTIQQAASAANPEFGASAMVQAANSISGFLGLQGSIDINSLEQMTKGRIFNPYTEQIFNNMSFRNHNFSFKMLARSPKEAENIWSICQWFKMGSHPTFESGKLARKVRKKKSQIGKKGKKYEPFDETINALKDLFGWNATDENPWTGRSSIMATAEQNRYFAVPRKFDIQFCRFDSQGTLVDVGTGDDLDAHLHFKIHPSVCTNVTVNYTPDNQYNALKRAGAPALLQVPAVVLNVQFTETKLLTTEDIQEGY